MRAIRPIAHLAAGAACAMALASCSTTSTGTASGTPSAPSSASPTPSSSALALVPTADPLTTAVEATASLGTARVTLGVSSRVGSAPEWRVAGSGTVDLADGQGYLVLREGGSDSEVAEQGILVNDDGAFVTVDEGRSWFALPPDRTTPHLDAVDVLRGLGGLPAGVVGPGVPAVVDGIDTTRYDAELPADDIGAAVAGLGVRTEDPAAFRGWQQPIMRLSVWVDARGRIVRIERSLTASTEAGALAATSIASLTDFGTGLDLSSPPSDAVKPAPEF